MAKCLNCGKEIKNKFCSISCENQYRAKLKRLEYETSPKLCSCCGKPLTWEQRRNKYCSSSCAAKINNIGICRVKKSEKQNTKSVSKIDIKTKTKGDLFEKRKNWQSARSSIRKDAERTIKKLNIEKKCFLCDYKTHIEIAHIRSVSSFSENSLISEINDINNLIYLCPNHHWEFDNEKLSKENLDKIKNYSIID